MWEKSGYLWGNVRGGGGSVGEVRKSVLGCGVNEGRGVDKCRRDVERSMGM